MTSSPLSRKKLSCIIQSLDKCTLNRRILIPNRRTTPRERRNQRNDRSLQHWQRLGNLRRLRRDCRQHLQLGIRNRRLIVIFVTFRGISSVAVLSSRNLSEMTNWRSSGRRIYASAASNPVTDRKIARDAVSNVTRNIMF